jgi:transcriptional regulator with GAF, ATPase, and Fis domain
MKHGRGANMNEEQIKFFMEGTNRINGSLEIEKALKKCFDLLIEHLPLNDIRLFHYNPIDGYTTIFAKADKTGGELTNMILRWPASSREWLESKDYPMNYLVNNANEHMFLGPAMKKLNKGKTSAMTVRFAATDNWISGVTLLADGWNRFTKKHMELFLLLREAFISALSNNRQYRELKALKTELVDDKNYLQKELQQTVSTEVIGADFGLKRVMNLIEQVAPLDSLVFLSGETGSGKEVLANTIHNLSNRKNGPFIKVNCGAIPESLMDSELFGHEKGAFTGAVEKSRGRFERSNGGTIFLDEIGELSPTAQIRLLRVVQENEIERVGGTTTIPVDIRIIAATHRNLEELVKKGVFREDLYFRLLVFPIAIPPLRERADDIPALTHHFLVKKTRRLGLAKIPDIIPGELTRLSKYNWPGNVRELENMVERAIILNQDGPISFDRLSPINNDRHSSNDTTQYESESLLMDTIISRHINRVLKITRGKIGGNNGAAELLGMNVSTLRHKMKKLNIRFGRST